MEMQSHRIDERQLDPAVALAALDDASPREPHRQFALKHEDCFVVADGHGDIRGVGDGLFIDDTRVLSLFRLKVWGHQPSLLGASLSQDNILFTANLSNRGHVPDGVPHGVIHIERSRFLWEERLYERIAVTNYWDRELRMSLRLEFGADFRDMFEVRGSTRRRRGHAHEADAAEKSVRFRYEGLDALVRELAINFSDVPAALTYESAEFVFDVASRERLVESSLRSEPNRASPRASASAPRLHEPATRCARNAG